MTNRYWIVLILRMYIFNWKRGPSSSDLMQSFQRQLLRWKYSKSVGSTSSLTQLSKAIQVLYLLTGRLDLARHLQWWAKSLSWLQTGGCLIKMTDSFCNQSGTCGKRCPCAASSSMSRPASLKSTTSSWKTFWTPTQGSSMLDGMQKMDFLSKI